MLSKLHMTIMTIMTMTIMSIMSITMIIVSHCCRVYDWDRVGAAELLSICKIAPERISYDVLSGCWYDLELAYRSPSELKD
jgi:hypothetical protein